MDGYDQAGEAYEKPFLLFIFIFVFRDVNFPGSDPLRIHRLPADL
jgi:hypothetical protein